MKISEYDEFGTNTFINDSKICKISSTQLICTAPPAIIFTAFMAEGHYIKKQKNKKTNSIACFLSTQTLSYIHNSRRHDRQDEVEPDVGEDAPEGGDEEHPEVFDLAALSVGNGPHAYPDDYKHVEGGAADDGPRPQLAGLKFMTAHLE